MNYQEFITAIENELSGRPDAPTFQIHRITKNNGVTYDGIISVRAETNVSPMIYLMPYYKRYLEGQPLSALCTDMIQSFRQNVPKKNFDSSVFTDFEKVSGHIVYRLVNYERNRELLTQIPHVKYLDFAVIFYCLLEVTKRHQASILIYNHHLALWNVSAEDLYALAHENTAKMLPAEMQDMASMVLSMLGPNALPLAELDCPMYILTNRYRTNGAAVLLYDGLLKELAEHFKSDLILLPSSIHELILIPCDHPSDPEVFRTMIAQVNEMELKDEEVLSDNAYLYSRAADEVTILK